MKNEGLPGVHYHPALTSSRSQSAIPRTATSGSLALYVHIPFCDKRCYFCEFAVVPKGSVTDSIIDEYLQALRGEMRSFAAIGGAKQPIEYIQFGGGTPTSLTATALEALFTFIFEEFDCSCLKEIVVEGFPNSITDDRIAVLEKVPNLKLSIGIQSFNVACLESVGRGHSELAEAAVARAVQSKIKNVGIDLIFGLPFSSPDTVRSDIELANSLGVDHCALYPLWIYEQTALDSRVNHGKVELPGRQSQFEQLSQAMDSLSQFGFVRYTAFHYALSDTSRHRYGMHQMLAQDWVGFGMSAMSHLDGNVFFNDRNIRNYLEKIKRGVSPSIESQQLSESEEMKFAFLYGLRLARYPISLFYQVFGVSIYDVFDTKLQHLRQNYLLTCDDDYISLTLSGILALGAIEDYVNDLSDVPILPVFKESNLA